MNFDCSNLSLVNQSDRQKCRAKSKLSWTDLKRHSYSYVNRARKAARKSDPVDSRVGVKTS